MFKFEIKNKEAKDEIKGLINSIRSHVTIAQDEDLAVEAINKLERLLNIETYTYQGFKFQKEADKAKAIMQLEKLQNMSEKEQLEIFNNAFYKECSFKEDEVYKDENSDLTIDNLDLGIRAYNCLKRSGIYTIKDIIKVGEKLKFMRNAGKKTVDEIITRLNKIGIDLIIYDKEKK